ncbi:MAG TPA: hypothetical protein VIG33_09400 [Pseudobdellovibrionaceae bacterium]|jgi:hypothetical protein
MKKMNLRLKAYDLLTATLVCLINTLIVSHALAAEVEPIVADYRSANDLVELHYPVETNLSYKERHETAGFMFSVGYENVILDRYVSIVDFTTFYQDMFGEAEFPVYGLNLSYKYNFSLGALTADFGLGYGSISDDGSGTVRSLELKKYSISGSYIMDMLFSEPYFAPYVTAGIMRLGLEEKAGEEKVTGNIDMLYFYQAGFLFQLNWLDPTVSRKNIIDYGLENTYLDIFVSKYEPSLDVNDPDTSTDYSIGAGIRMEF